MVCGAAGRRCFFREPSAGVLAARAASNFAISSPIDALLTRHQPRGVVRVPPSRPFLSIYWTMRRDLPRMRAALSTPTVAATSSSLPGGSCCAVFRCRLRLRRAASGCRTRLPVVNGVFPGVSYQSSVTSSQWRILCVPTSLFPASLCPSPFSFFLCLLLSLRPPCWSVPGFFRARKRLPSRPRSQVRCEPLPLLLRAPQVRFQAEGPPRPHPGHLPEPLHELGPLCTDRRRVAHPSPLDC